MDAVEFPDGAPFGFCRAQTWMLGRLTRLSSTYLSSDLARSRAALHTCRSTRRAPLTISARSAGRSCRHRVLGRELATRTQVRRRSVQSG